MENIISRKRDITTHKRENIWGIVPHMGLPIEKLLSVNLGRIFAARGITSAAKAETELRVPKSTIDRAWHCRSMARLDTLSEVADGLKIQPWQLLVPDLDPYNMPLLQGEPTAKLTAHQETEPAQQGKLDADEVIQLLSAYSQSTQEGRMQILRLARNVKKIESTPSIRPATTNQRK